jgi:mRNA interferase HigB
MRLIGKQPLHDFKRLHPDAKSKVESWESEIEDASWQNPYEMKQKFPTADPVGHNNTIFNICGNRYRLWVIINYENQIVFVKKIGTHPEYEKWNII